MAPTNSARLKITFDAVATRGWNWDRSQYVIVTLDGNEKHLELYHECRGSGTCDNHPPTAEICGAVEIPQHWNPELDYLTVPTFFEAEVPFCRQEVAIKIVLVHRFFAGGDTPVVDDSFTYNASKVQENRCSFGEKDGNRGGLSYLIESGALALADSDGDGLSDYVETVGFDRDCDGVLAVGTDFLPGKMGATSNKKDVFIQINWFDGSAPTKAEIDQLRVAFANAPPGAGGSENPDGSLGIHLIVDAGDYRDSSGQLVGDDLGYFARGGGNLGDPFIPKPGQKLVAPTSLEEASELAFNYLLDSSRDGFVRHIMLGPMWEPDFGGVADFNRGYIYANEGSANLLMHELGHTFGLGQLHT